MKNMITKKITGIVLSVAMIVSTCFTGTVVFGENEIAVAPTYSHESIYEQLKNRGNSLPTPIEPEIKYETRESINIEDSDQLFNILQPKANTEPRKNGATMMSAWREHYEKLGKSPIEETESIYLSKLSENETISFQNLQPDFSSSEVESAYCFAIRNLADGKTVNEINSALLLSEILDVTPQSFLCSDNISETTISATLTKAEEDFLYFYPAEIDALRLAVSDKYGRTDTETYEMLFAELAKARAASSGEPDEPEILEAPHTPFFGYNSGENEYIDIKSGDLRYTEPLIFEQGVGGFDFDLNLVYNSKESKNGQIEYYYAGVVCENSKSESSIHYYFGNGWKLDLPYHSNHIQVPSYVYIPGIGMMETSDLPTKYVPETSITVGDIDSESQITLENGTTYWFSSDGRILRQQDKYGNKIDFHHLAVRTNNICGIDYIVDSAGRIYDFSYTGSTKTLENSQTLHVTTTIITKPDGSEIIIKNTAVNANNTTLDSISYELSENYFAEKIFTYETAESIITGSKSDDSLTNPSMHIDGKNYYLIDTVTYPDNAVTHFSYEPYVYDICSLAAQSAYRVTERYEGIESNKNNRYYYVYEGSSTGYPNYSYGTGFGTTVSTGNESIEQPYEFGVSIYNQYEEDPQNYYLHKTTESIDGDYVFHYETIKYNYGPSRTYDTETTVYTDDFSLVESVSNFYYNLETYSTLFESNIEYTYDGFDVTSYNNPRGNTTDELYKTYITYDDDYKLPLTKTYKTDPSTTVQIVNTLTADKKSIAKAETFVNNILTAKTEYLYDTFGNVIQTKEYYDLTPNDEKFITTSYNYTDNVAGRNLDGVYITSKTVLGVTDADGNTIGNITESYIYDISGNVISKTDANGNTYSSTYDYFGNVTSATAPNSRVDNYIYMRFPGATLNAYILLTPLRADRIYHWDHYGNYTGISRANPETNSFDFNIANYVYDSYSNLSYTTNVSGLEGYFYKEYTRNGYGDAVAMKVYGNGNTLEYFEEYSYDPRAVANGEDMYTPHNAVYTRVCDDSGTDILQSSVKYYNMYGDLVMEDTTSETYLSESANHYSYDTNGNLLETWIYTEDHPHVALETYTYDYAGRLTSVADAYGNTSYITYDALGRKASESDKLGNYIYYTYNDLGRVIKVDSPFNAVTRSQKKMYYDANGNLIKEMQSNNADDTAVLTFDTVEYAYDCMNNLTDVITHVSATEKNYVHYEYDVAGQMTKMVTGLSSPYVEGSTAGNVTEYAYDLDGNCISVTDALDNTEYYTYNHNKVVTSATDRNGTVSEFTYNALGSPLTEEYYQNDELVYSKEYTYDDAGRLIDNGYDIYYMYDERGRVITEFQGDHIIDYSYDDRGRKSERILWADGQYDVSTTTYTYDLMSRLTEVSNSSMPTATQNTYYTYTPNGQILTETTGGLVTSYEYNNAGLVTKKTNKVGDVEPGSVYGGVSDFSTHTYYTNGNMMSKFSQADLCDTSYTYDGAGRLTLEFFQSSGPDYQTIYQYDASGNRSRQTYIFDPYNETNDLVTTVTEYTYDANNRLTSVTTGTDTLSYTYDNNGNMLSESNGKTYSYNVLNQLVTFVNGENTTTYTYLPNGLRASKTSGNNENHIHSDFAWDGDDLVYEYVRNMYYYPPFDNCIVYNYGNGLISQSNTETNEYILFTKNTHGDVADMLNAASTDLAVFEDKEFDAFGNGGSTGYSAMGYAGQYHDYETGFIYLRARYYSPAVGRFISEDPYWNVENMVYGEFSKEKTSTILENRKPTNLNFGNVIVKNKQENLKSTHLPETRIQCNFDIAIKRPSPDIYAVLQSSNLYQYGINNPIRYIDVNGKSATLAIGTVTISYAAIVKGVSVIIGLISLAKNIDKSQKVNDVLKTRKGSIQNAPKPSGTPGWDAVRDLTMGEILRRAQNGDVGYKTIWKLLTDGRFKK